MSAVGVGGWDNEMSWGEGVGGEDLCDPLEMGSGGEERQPQVVCCKLGMRPGE